MKYLRILIISTGGPLATMLATPLLKALQEIAQQGVVDAVTAEPVSGEILAANRLCNDIILMDRGIFKSRRVLKRLLDRRYTHSLILFPCSGPKAYISAFWSGARTRIAHAMPGRSRSLLFRLLVNAHVPERPGLHAVKQNLNIVSVFDPLFQVEVEHPFLELASEHRGYAEDFLKKNNLSGESITGIYPGNGRLPPEPVTQTEWPAESYAILCGKLASEKNKQILLFDSPWDTRGAVDKIIQSSKHSGKIVMHSDSSPLKTAAVIEKCSSFITGDNVFAHIGSAMRVPTLSIFGPTNPALTGPTGSHSYIARNNTNCPACAAGETLKHGEPHTCLADLKPAEIWNTVESLIGT